MERMISIRCKCCKQRLCDYTLQGDGAVPVLLGISLKCGKCKRVLRFKKYTEALIKQGSVNGSFMV